MKRSTRFSIAFASILSIVSLITLEAILAFLLNHTDITSGQLRETLRQFYLDHDRKIIQLLPECAMFDPELFYTLKPGFCQIQAREFDVEYSINSAGLRDDEDALIAPEIIVLGDSFAMGWGVEKSENFSTLLREMTGMKTLNAGISSYGTARELALLKRLDTRKLKYLIIQHCDNDAEENSSFLKNHNELVASTETEYLQQSHIHTASTVYYPGKYTQLIFTDKLKHTLRDRSLDSSMSQRNIDTETDDAINIIQQAGILKTGVQVIIFDIHAYGRNDNRFIAALDRKAHRTPETHNISTLDISGSLDETSYFPLDGHINQQGHEVIAKKLASRINVSYP